MLLGLFVGVDGKVRIPQRAFQHRGGVRTARGGVDALFREQKRDVAKEGVELHAPLLVRHLEVALCQDFQADCVLVARAKHLLQVLLLGQDALADVAEDCLGLQHLVQVLFTACANVCEWSSDDNHAYMPARQLSTLFL